MSHFHTGILKRNTRAPIPPVYLCGDVGSVLDVAHTLTAEHCLPVWGSAIARSQSQGRGQFRRVWVSPPGNIYAAVRLPFVEPFAGGAGSPAFGALLANAFARQGAPLLLKWPNDLLRAAPDGAKENWGKVAGVLLEERAGALIAGVGANISSAPEEACPARENGLKALCLFEKEQGAWSEHRLFDLWLRLVDSLLICYHHWKNTGENAWFADADRRLAWKGRRVLIDDGEPHEGELLGPALDGGIRLLCADGERKFSSGTLKVVRT